MIHLANQTGLPAENLRHMRDSSQPLLLARRYDLLPFIQGRAACSIRVIHRFWSGYLRQTARPLRPPTLNSDIWGRCSGSDTDSPCSHTAAPIAISLIFIEGPPSASNLLASQRRQQAATAAKRRLARGGGRQVSHLVDRIPGMTSNCRGSSKLLSGLRPDRTLFDHIGRHQIVLAITQNHQLHGMTHSVHIKPLLEIPDC